jgi:hypothetical protein
MLPITTSVRVDTRITYLGRVLSVIIFIFRPVPRRPAYSLRSRGTFMLFSTWIVYHFAYSVSKLARAGASLPEAAIRECP